MVAYLQRPNMGANWTLSSPLSQQQKTVWSLIRQGLSAAAIATKLRTTRQFVNQTKLAAEAKLSTTLLDVAQANDIQVTKIYPNQGLLVGYHPGVGHKVIVTYSTTHGIKVWYWHDDPEHVTNEEFLKHTRRYLLDIARERHIDVKGDSESMHPGRLAHSIFSELIPELKA
jgi:DNA-binding CsgD family transcriptional regulator